MLTCTFSSIVYLQRKSIKLMDQYPDTNCTQLYELNSEEKVKRLTGSLYLARNHRETNLLDDPDFIFQVDLPPKVGAINCFCLNETNRVKTLNYWQDYKINMQKEFTF